MRKGKAQHHVGGLTWFFLALLPLAKQRSATHIAPEEGRLLTGTISPARHARFDFLAQIPDPVQRGAFQLEQLRLEMRWERGRKILPGHFSLRSQSRPEAVLFSRGLESKLAVQQCEFR